MYAVASAVSFAQCMGIIEETNKKRTRRRNMQKLVLETVAVAGLVSVALVAPNVLGAMGKLGLLPSRRQQESINAARTRLLKKGLLKRDARGFLRLTPQGQKTLEKMRVFENGLPRPRRWDKKWRVLTFDIPYYRRGLGEKVRRGLQAAGFALFQKSVWIYPYDCEDFIALLKADLKIGKDMRYLIVDSIEGDRAYREQFGLRLG